MEATFTMPNYAIIKREKNELEKLYTVHCTVVDLCLQIFSTFFLD